LLNPKGGGAAAYFTVTNNGFSGSWAVLTGGTLTPSTTNYSLGTDGATTILNAATSASPIDFRLGNGAAMRLAGTTGNLLIGGTTDITGSGGLKVFGTTAASSTTSGALQVGSNVGLSGNAGGASYFGGQVVLLPSSGTSRGRINNDPGRADVFNVGANWTGASQDDNTKPSWFAQIDGRVAGDSYSIQRAAPAGSPVAILSASASGVINIPATTSASSSTAGALTIGNGTAATNVAIGGGNVNAGGTGTFGGDVTIPSSILYTNRVYNYTGGATPLILGWTGSAAVLSLFSSGAATFAGAVTVSSTTAGSAGAGALVVSGGLATGAASYFGGNVTVAGTGIQVNAAGFGGAPNSYYAISSAQTLSGNGNQAFLNVSPTFNADAAGGQGNVLWVQGRTAASYTLAALAGLKVESPSIGAGGAVTTVYGLRIQDQTGGGTNYAIFTGAGRVSFGDLVFPQQAATAPTYVKGAIYFDSTLNKLRVGGATGWETITSV
jgi:hypothetical protein